VEGAVPKLVSRESLERVDLISEPEAIAWYRAMKIQQVSPIAPIASSWPLLDDHYIAMKLKSLGLRFPLDRAAFYQVMTREFPDNFSKIPASKERWEGDDRRLSRQGRQPERGPAKRAMIADIEGRLTCARLEALKQESLLNDYGRPFNIKSRTTVAAARKEALAELHKRGLC
jgi:hypothetical protein